MSEALAAALAADAALAGAFRGRFSQGQADRDRRLPYCVFARQEVRPLYQTVGRRSAVRRATYSFHAFARTAEARFAELWRTAAGRTCLRASGGGTCRA